MDLSEAVKLRPSPRPQPANPPVNPPAGPPASERVAAVGGSAAPRAATPAVAAASPTQPAGRPPQGSGAWLLALQALALKHDDAEAAAVGVLGDLALKLGCERASLGWHQGGRVQLAALSAGDPRTRQNLARCLEKAMDEALDERAVICHPARAGSDTAASGAATAAHAELLRHNGHMAVATLPILAGERLLGALLLERRGGFGEARLRAAQDAALFVFPLLEMQHRLQRPLAGRWAQAISPRGLRLARLSPRPARLAALALLPLAVVIGALPMQLEVVAPARLEGGEQRVIAAPFDGYVASATVRPGAEVKAGELLVTLQERDLELQRQRWQAEAAQLDKQYREALTHDEPAPIAIARAKLEQTQAQLALAERELARARITAPFDGVVISGDLHQATGMPVQRGQTLLTLAPVLRLKVVAEVDEQDIALLAPGQSARVLFAAQGQAVERFTVGRVSPVATTVEGRNIFEIEGTLQGAAAADAAATPPAALTLRPGQRGVVRVEVGERRIAEVAWLQAGHWVRRWVWRVLG